MTWDDGQPHWKPSRTARKRATVKKRRQRQGTLADNKRLAKQRDGNKCRFPLCGCQKRGDRLESAHKAHAGMGGDSTGARAQSSNLITVCGHRHRTGVFALDRGTLQTRFLSARGYDDPIVWLIDSDEYGRRTGIDVFGQPQWRIIAIEDTVNGRWLRLQQDVLQRLSQMDL